MKYLSVLFITVIATLTSCSSTRYQVPLKQDALAQNNTPKQSLTKETPKKKTTTKKATKKKIEKKKITPKKEEIKVVADQEPVYGKQKKADRVYGKVISVKTGKDGYTAIVQTKDNVSYKAIVSISNLGRHGGYEIFEVGNNVAFLGTIWKMENKNKITVRKILSTNTEHFKVKGIVESIENGKDGYTARIKANDSIYYATISFANLGENHTKYKQFMKGDEVYVYGELWFLGDKKQITVRDILS
ncbi:hypothetical protein [Aureivirga marina]|uniref:hypothetical protein n=1 Tax=Aureivirga marina TaxID=1182451 RepID=UPI0018CB34AB|nr:hypothetical protein [Aureivirga marina]